MMPIPMAIALFVYVALSAFSAGWQARGDFDRARRRR